MTEIKPKKLVKKPIKIAEEVIPAAERHPKAHQGNTWNVSKVFWGLSFIVVGGLVLADNFNIVNVNWGNLWRLWPLMIISAGLSILTFRNWIWRVISIILVILSMGAITWVAIGGYSYDDSLRMASSITDQITNEVKQAEININAGASTLQVNSEIQNTIARATLESNYATLSESSSLAGDIQKVNMSMNVKGDEYWWAGDMRSIFKVYINRSLPIKLNVDTGASSTDIDMSKARLSSISVKTGASSLVVKLGDLMNSTSVKIDSGVSSIKIQIPKDSGVQLDLQSGLTSNNLADLQKSSSGLYESSNYSNANKKVNIISKIGVSSFTIERY